MIEALKAKDSVRSSVLKQIHSELLMVAKSNRPMVDEFEVLQRCINRWTKAIEEYDKLLSTAQDEQRGKIREILERERTELDIIRTFLPSQYSNAELRQMIETTICEQKTSNSGMLMKAMIASLDASRYNKHELAELIKNRLAHPVLQMNNEN